MALCHRNVAPICRKGGSQKLDRWLKLGWNTHLTICYDKTDEKDYEYIDPQNLTNILYFIHSLNTAGFDIMVGYSFMNSVLFAMLNCEAVATGWFNNIRKFNRDRFEESETMGRRKKRYTSLPLFTYITFDNLNNASQSIALDDLLSGCIIDEYMSNSQDSISFVDLEQQYWQALSIIIEQINHYNSLSDRINHVLSELTNAKKLYASILNTLTDNKEAFNRIKSTSKHLDSWIMGIEAFKNRISLF